jgi:RNA polymerase sigma-70 factor (ECF subfamily)
MSPTAILPDVIQQILFAIAHPINNWKEDGNAASFRRWLNTVARNGVIRFMASERRQLVGVGGSDLISLLQNIEDKPNEKYISDYRHELIVWAAEQVRHEFLETSWKAFWATLIDRRPVEQVALELHVSPSSIYMSRSRIIGRIRKKIVEHGFYDHSEESSHP